MRSVSDYGLQRDAEAETRLVCVIFTLTQLTLHSVVRFSDTTRADTESGTSADGHGAARAPAASCQGLAEIHRHPRGVPLHTGYNTLPDRAAFFPHNSYYSLCPLACSHVHVQHGPRAAPAAQAVLPQDRLKTPVPN